MPRCSGTKDNGDPCGSPENLVDPETGLCPAHQPGGRERLKEAARKGAQATKRAWKGKGLDPDALPPLDSAHAAERWAEVVGRAVATGQLSHSQGKAISSLLREWRQSHDAGEYEERLKKLQAEHEAFKAGKIRELRKDGTGSG